MNKLLLTLILGMFLITLVSASLPDVKQGQCVNIKTILNTSEVTISSLTYPNYTQALGIINMEKNGLSFNYTFCDTSSLGIYFYDYNDSEGNVWENDFRVGSELTTGKAVVYIGFIIILLFIFILTLGGAIKVNWQHGRNAEGKIITVNDFRYVKVFLFAMAYLEIMFLFGLSYKLFNEANIEGFTQFFNFVYQLFLNLIYPIIIVAIIFTFVIWINNLKLKKKRSLGL